MNNIEFQSVDDNYIRKICDDILASPIISSSKNLSSLFTYICNEEIAGRGDRLKAYSIAVDALGRGPDFDPVTNCAVRVEMLRLRRALELVRARSPERDAVAINAGSYRPYVVRGNRSMAAYAYEMAQAADADQPAMALAGDQDASNGERHGAEASTVPIDGVRLRSLVGDPVLDVELEFCGATVRIPSGTDPRIIDAVIDSLVRVAR